MVRLSDALRSEGAVFRTLVLNVTIFSIDIHDNDPPPAHQETKLPTGNFYYS